MSKACTRAWRIGAYATVLLAVALCAGPAGAAAADRITVDPGDDLRMTLAVQRLREVAAEPAFAAYRFVVGRDAAREVLGNVDLRGLGPEGFLIRTAAGADGPRVVVTGHDVQGVAYGVFRLARILRSAPERLPKLSLRMKPAFAIREQYEEHSWGRPNEMERYKALLQRYLEEGINTLDVPYGWFEPPPGTIKGQKTFVSDNPATVRQVIDYAHSLGIKVFIVEDAYLNPLFHEPKENLAEPWAGGLSGLLAQNEAGAPEPILLCLGKPEARDLIRRNREMVYATVPNADGIVVYFGDPGGCWHPECRPHGRKIVEHLNGIHAPLLRANPHLEVILTLWGISLEDTTYLVDHLDDLPASVIALQIPPTSQRPGSYLCYEPARGRLIRRAARKLPVIAQQFYDGVGFRDGWVDFWQHPMPREMQRSLLGSYGPNVVGVYGSAFEPAYQMVDVRLGMEWGWNPRRHPAAILREYGSEQFGRGVGGVFAPAMFALESYWAREARRFHFDDPIPDGALPDLRASLADATNARDWLKSAQSRVVRGRQDYQAFLDLAELTVAAGEANLRRAEAQRLSDNGKTGEAIAVAAEALAGAERVVALASGSPHYRFLTTHPWWKWWDIARRPQRSRDLLEDLRSPGSWQPVPLQNPSFEQRDLDHSGAGTLAYVGDAHAGATAIRLGAGGAAWSAVSPAEFIRVKAGARYRVEFWAKVVKGTPRLYLDWFIAENDGANTEVTFAARRGWQRCRVELQTPELPGETEMRLRFVAHTNKQDLLLDDVSVWMRGP